MQIPPVLTRDDRDLEQPKRLQPQSRESAASANTNYLALPFCRTSGKILATVLEPDPSDSGEATTTTTKKKESLFK